MDPLHQALADFVPGDATEIIAVERVRALLDADDAWSRALPLHVTASALVVHPPTRRVLLRWHPRLGGWFQVGGHGDPGETDPWTVARREAEEETGLTDLAAPSAALDRRPVQVVVVPVPAANVEPDHEHADVRYLFATADPEAIRPESDAAAVRWFTLPEARAAVTEANLHTLLDRAAARLDTQALT